MKIKILLIAAFTIITLPAYAQKDVQPAPEKEESVPLDFPVAYRYQPEYCDFTAAFPEKPAISTTCEKEDEPDTCFKLASFTKVFNMSTTVSIKIICNPADTKMFEHFTSKIMEATVRKMTEGSVLETFNVNTTDKKDYRISGLIGQGKKGLDKTLFIAQLWISKKSIMSVEAEISGNTLKEADELFAGLLNHVGYAKDLTPPDKNKDKNKSKNKNKDKANKNNDKNSNKKEK